MAKPGAAVQTATPALRKWIIAQAEAGFSADVVLASMRASGWDEDVANAALEATLTAHLQAQSQQPQRPAAVPVPSPALDGAPLWLDAGDRPRLWWQRFMQARSSGSTKTSKPFSACASMWRQTVCHWQPLAAPGP